MKQFSQMNTKDIIGFVKGVDKKTWGKFSVVAIGAVFFLIVFVYPAWIERPILRREIQGMEAQIRQVSGLNQKKPVWEEDQRSFSDVLERTNGRLFSREGVGLLLGQVSKLAVESKVDVLASKPVNEKIVYAAPYNSKYEANGYDFTLQGGYHDFGMLANRIETYSRLLRIQSIHILPSEKTPGKQISEWRLSAISKSTQPAVAMGPYNAKK